MSEATPYPRTPLEKVIDGLHYGADDWIQEFEAALWRVIQRERNLNRSCIQVRPMTPAEAAKAP